MTVTELLQRWNWHPIRGCPGRLVLRGAPPNLSLSDLVGPAVPIQSYGVAAARDQVLVAILSDGGLISYRRDDGSYVHTLNTPEGLARKLGQLGIGGPNTSKTGGVQ